MEIEHLNKTDFEQKTNQNNLVIVDFFATWCGPCRMLSPILSEVGEQMKGVTFYKVDVDENQDLAKKFGVMSIPTIIALKNGKEIDRNIGLLNREDLTEFVEKNI